MFRVHSVSQRPNLRYLGEPLGGAESLPEAVNFKKTTEGMGQFWCYLAPFRRHGGCSCACQAGVSHHTFSSACSLRARDAHDVRSTTLRSNPDVQCVNYLRACSPRACHGIGGTTIPEVLPRFSSFHFITPA